MEECIIKQAAHFLEVTKHIFKDRGFLFSTAFVIGDDIEVIKLDLSTEEKKNDFSDLVKRRFYETHATHLIVIQEAWVYQMTPEQLQELGDDTSSYPEIDDNTIEAILVYISTPETGEVWQVPFRREENGIAFDKRQILRTIVSENWMINKNKELALQLN